MDGLKVTVANGKASMQKQNKQSSQCPTTLPERLKKSLIRSEKVRDLILLTGVGLTVRLTVGKEGNRDLQGVRRQNAEVIAIAGATKAFVAERRHSICFTIDGSSACNCLRLKNFWEAAKPPSVSQGLTIWSHYPDCCGRSRGLLSPLWFRLYVCRNRVQAQYQAGHRPLW